MNKARVDPHLVFGISLFAALLLSWPALSGAMHGRVDIVQAGVRLLVAMAICWAGCYAVASLVYGYAQSPSVAPQPTADTVDPNTPQRRAADPTPTAVAPAGDILEIEDAA